MIESEITLGILKHLVNLLKCSICLDTFQVPKYLPCLHTFCESCITTFVHQDTAFTLSVLNWQGSHSFSDCVIACLSTIETIKLFSGIEVYCVDHSRPCCTLCATLSHRKCESVLSIDTAATGIKQSTKALDLSNELQQKSKHIDEMIENRKENIVVWNNLERSVRFLTRLAQTLLTCWTPRYCFHAFCIKLTGIAQFFRLCHCLLVNHGDDEII
jgi:hypothetical protein